MSNSCSECKFAQRSFINKPDPIHHKPVVECKNRNSDYYGAALNITSNGKVVEKITWQGCEYFWGVDSCGNSQCQAREMGRIMTAPLYGQLMSYASKLVSVPFRF